MVVLIKINTAVKGKIELQPFTIVYIIYSPEIRVVDGDHDYANSILEKNERK